MRFGSSTSGTLVVALGLFAGAALSGCGQDRLTSLDSASSPATLAAPARLAPGNAGILAAIQSDDEVLLEESSTDSRTITGPTVITEPGYYRVTRDFSVDAKTGDGIVVRASGVVLWLGGHAITGPGAKVGRGIVVEGARHVLVQGGRLMRFGVGVVLDGATLCAVRGVEIGGANEFADPGAGIPPQIGVLLLNSSECRFARNRMDGVNLGVFVRGPGSYQNRIRHNHVVGGSNGLLGVCYNPAPGGGPAGPSRDEVERNTFSRFGKGIQTSAGSAYNRFVRNQIEYFALPWEDFNGTNVFLRNQASQVTP